MFKNQTETTLALRALRLLLGARKKQPHGGGVTALGLVNGLEVIEIRELESVMRTLRDNKLVEVGERVFLISEEGVDYLLNNDPGDLNFTIDDKNTEFSSDNFPPDDDSGDSSGVSRVK